MSSAALNSWIKSNLQVIPAIPHYANLAKKAVRQANFEKTPLSQIISSDPGLSSQLFNLINSKRKATKRDYLESVQSALSLMGDAGIIHFIDNMTTLDDVRTSFDCVDDYLQLVARAQHAAKHAKLWAEKRQSQGIKEIGIASKLFDIAEYSLCLFDHELYVSYRLKNLSDYNPEKNCSDIWGFSLNQLALALCDHLHLPELVKEAHNLTEIAGIRTQGIKIASELVHQADLSWYHNKTNDCLIKAADLCQISLDIITTWAHITSVKAAQELPYKVKFHSAANLIQHRASFKPVVLNTKEQPKPVIKTIEKPVKEKIAELPKAPPNLKVNPLLSELKAKAQHKQTSQAAQLNALLTGCHKHLNMGRNALFLINQDRSIINTRLHSGLADDSPLLKFTTKRENSGLIKILLEKPQAIWINPDNFRKYDQMLPGLFKSCTLSDDFFMMSLFSGEKPLGIVFCDKYGQAESLDKTAFTLFKQAVGLTSKAMLLIAQRNRAANKK